MFGDKASPFVQVVMMGAVHIATGERTIACGLNVGSMSRWGVKPEGLHRSDVCGLCLRRESHLHRFLSQRHLKVVRKVLMPERSAKVNVTHVTVARTIIRARKDMDFDDARSVIDSLEEAREKLRELGQADFEITFEIVDDDVELLP